MSYFVDYSGVILQRLQQLQQEATAAGKGEAFARAAAELHDLLEANPHAVGEEIYHTPMGFPVRSVVRGPVAMSFVIYDSHQAVCITKVDRIG